ncbi:MAG TPA: rhamnulokinase family protein [Candidatus Brocadiia bacterium]|nr:rhamnulokinase family protein [Candidatus Brocadiia bacterium]
MAQKKFLALDMGAESGRGVMGLLNDGRLELRETHRFPNVPVRVHDNLFWNALGQFAELKTAVSAAVAQHGRDIESIGIDTWGVDMALIGAGNTILGNVHHYRDPRTSGVMDELFKTVPRRDVFLSTGIQFMEINTLYQIYCLVLNKSPLLKVAERLLMIGDLFNFMFTGQKVSEFTLATTSQMFDARADEWAQGMLKKLGIPTDILPEVVSPGTDLGPVVKSVADEIGVPGLKVIAPAVHDTGSAVAGVPASGDGWCYISSGTWCLMGVETKKPVVTDLALANNFTNEGGVGGTYRFLRNIVGLWLVQECRREWEKQGKAMDYARMTELAAKSAPRRSFINPEHLPFYSPGNMPQKIQDFCRETGQPAPETEGEIVRCALESLALKYRSVLESIEEMTGRNINRIHIVGGGSKNRLLNQLAADATGRTVHAGPVEATAIGNILVQAMAVSELGSLDDARKVARDSFPLETYEPTDSAGWNEAYGKFKSLCSRQEARF